ncbi:MAG TPA: 50S ribosomal protein L11 methyltransferase, partial [Methylomirabilota bacterium]|nr:50S ribosomal protein L11 methyltransferase [Methylomirabilota bacterium]
MPFWQLTVPTSADSTDGLTNFLWEQGALGVVEEEAPGAPPRLRAFFAESMSSTALLAAVDGYRASLRALGFSLDPGSAEIGPLLDEAWASAWQQSFPARAVGRRLRVLPPWLDDAESEPAHGPADRASVIIEPGRAFGTGHHGTTEGCLVLLEDALEREPGAPVLDVGTGTGILAIAALKLGAASALALDVSSVAVEATRANADANGIGDRLEARVATLEGAAGEPYLPLPPDVAILGAEVGTYDLALANIIARVI